MSYSGNVLADIIDSIREADRKYITEMVQNGYEFCEQCEQWKDKETIVDGVCEDCIDEIMESNDDLETKLDKLID